MQIAPKIRFRNLHRVLDDYRRDFTIPTLEMSKGQVKKVVKEAKIIRRKAFRKEPELIKFHEWFMKLRSKFGISDVKFAILVGVSRETIRNIKLNYGHIPSNSTMEKLERLDRRSKIKVKTSVNGAIIKRKGN